MSHPDENEPITLAKACEIFPHAKLTISTLRAEAERGHLDIFRLGKRDYTTLHSMREMVIKCQEESRRRGSTSTRNGANGSSETAQASSAQAALKQTHILLTYASEHLPYTATAKNVSYHVEALDQWWGDKRLPPWNEPQDLAEVRQALPRFSEARSRGVISVPKLCQVL